jgi:hypothetical protein
MQCDITWPRAVGLVLSAMSLLISCGGAGAASVDRKSFDIAVSSWDRKGGLIAADVNRDGQRDLIITQPSVIVAYTQSGTKLWTVAFPDIQLGGQSPKDGLPGLHGPGVQAGDIDNDGTTEVLYVTTGNQLRVINGRTGRIERSINLPAVSSHFNRWEHAIISNFRGQGDRDLLLSASVAINSNGYLRDTKIAAYSFASLASAGAGAKALWRRTDFVSPSHGPPRVVDLDFDGRDEVVGGIVVGHDGSKHVDIGVGNNKVPHIDSLAISNIDPDSPGLEAVIAEEGSERRVIMFNKSKVLWSKSRKPATDGDKVQIGDYAPNRKGWEIFLRGAESNDMWMMDRSGNRIAAYDFDTAKRPQSWTDAGIEDIFRIHWTGGRKLLNAAKERHKAGDVGIFDPLTAEFIEVFDEAADRVYVVDLVGDWREEVVVISGRKLTIYRNLDANPRPNQRSLWSYPHYRRLKMTWNYYSP